MIKSIRKEAVKKCANSPVVCTTPKSLYSWTIFKSRTKLSKSSSGVCYTQQTVQLDNDQVWRKSIQGTVPTLRWCVQHPTNCAARHWSALGQSLKSTVPTLQWCAQYPTDCSWTMFKSIRKEPVKKWANSLVVRATPNKLCSWTMIGNGKKATKNCANCLVVCTTPTKLCSRIMTGFGKRLQRTVPTVWWCAQCTTSAGQCSSLFISKEVCQLSSGVHNTQNIVQLGNFQV